MMTAIGAYCHITWKEFPDNLRYVFISFAEDCEEEGADKFGTHDSQIFYFCSEGEDGIKGLMGDDSREDFRIHDYEVKWKEIV